MMIEQCNFKECRTKDAESINGCFILQHICTIAQLAPNQGKVQSPLEIFNAKCVLEGNCVLYQAYRNGAISQLPVAGKTVVRCPVCDGRGTVPYGFYPDQPRDATGVGHTTQCRGCMGRGIIGGDAP